MRRMERALAAAGAAAMLLGVLALAAPAAGEVCNVKVVTDANPDYHDIGSMIHSITSNWPETRDKCWALFYWNHIARRQTAPMKAHGNGVTDPIRQFNDYGYMMCSTIAGTNCAMWGAMGLKVKLWDITLHTVCEVEYDGTWHMYDNSMSALYTTCDGKRLAGVAEIGADGACAASGGKTEAGHIAKYHCLYATGPKGFLTGADCPRDLAQEYRCFNPRGLKFRWYYNHWDLAHRYILNLRRGEVYTRHYRRLDAASPGAVAQGKRKGYKADPAYFVPNNGNDPEATNPRYRIRGNGLRTYAPALAGDLAKVAHAVAGVQAPAGGGVQPAQAGQVGEIVFKVEGANVITSLTVHADFLRKTADDLLALAVSITNGLRWKEVFSADKTGPGKAEVKLVEPVNGAYEVLVKAQLMGKAAPADAVLKNIRFETVTQLNSKTQPMLRLGRNTVHVGAGEQTGSIVLWPDLRDGQYKQVVVEAKNVAAGKKHPSYMGVLHADKPNEEAYVVFRLDAPKEITKVTYGGRFYNRAPKAHIDMLHSFDGGRTWTKSYSLTDTRPPWDVIHYERAAPPPRTKSVLLKYLWNGSQAGSNAVSIYAVRMEANHAPANPTSDPVEVTFTWKERQADYSLVQRSHTQRVEKLPATYTVSVGGADHPVMESLRVNLAGAAGDVKPGYSDGKDAGGQKFQDRWVTYGKVLSTGRPYTCTAASRTGWGAGDPEGKVLTDGIVGPPYTGGIAYRFGALWHKGDKPVITVDLGQARECGAFRIQVGGYPWWDAVRGQVKDTVEVLTSTDDKAYAPVGQFDFNLRWKDVPANHMWTDEETFKAHNFELIPPKPVGARYVRFKLTPRRIMSVSEVQVLESIRYKPFDIKIALPDGKDRSDITKYDPKHTPSKP